MPMYSRLKSRLYSVLCMAVLIVYIFAPNVDFLAKFLDRHWTFANIVFVLIQRTQSPIRRVTVPVVKRHLIRRSIILIIRIVLKPCSKLFHRYFAVRLHPKIFLLSLHISHLISQNISPHILTPAKSYQPSHSTF